jgi:CRP-like cAMP-binding protein
MACELSLEEFKKGDVVINLGDKGNKFYIILKGIVSINKRNPLIADWKA